MNRRNFIYSSGLLATSAWSATSAMAASGTLKTLPGGMGIQLYMVRNDMERDTPGTLKQLGQLGYKQLESYGSDKGVFWGMKNTEFKKLAADNNLKLVSTHHNPVSIAGFEQMAAQSAEIGMKYMICPWLGPQKSMEAFKRFADDFNQRGAICKKHGLRYGYHPHDYPYKPVNGQLPINVLLANTDPDLVDYQMDVYYTVTEGQDPYAFLKKYNGRFKLMHMRDVLKVRLPAGSKDESSCDLGEGIVNYPPLIQAGIAEGMQYFFVEGERYYKETPMQSAQKNAAYLKRMRLV